MKWKRWYCIAAILLFSPVTLAAQGLPSGRLFSRNLRSLGMGGAAVAVPIADNPFFANPALFAGVPHGRLNLVDLRFRFNQAFFDQLNFYLDHRDEINNTDQLTPEEQNQLFADALREAQKLANVILEGPVPMHYKRRNFGIGLFTQANVKYEIFAGAAGLPILNLAFQSNVLLTAAYARTFKGLLPNPLSVGIGAKFLYRTQTQKTKSLAGFTENEEFEVYEGQVFSVDIGLLYPVTRTFHVGVAFYDINAPEFNWSVNTANPVTPAPQRKLESTMRIGFAYYPNVGIGKLLYNIRLGLDIDRPFDSEVTFFKKVFMGAEANITPILLVRWGFYQGYPAVGAGLNFHVVRVNLAFYGEEMGKYAGDFVSWNRAISVQLGF